MQLVAQHVEYYLNHRAQGQLIIGAVLYSNAMGELGRTTQAERLLENLINFPICATNKMPFSPIFTAKSMVCPT